MSTTRCLPTLDCAIQQTVQAPSKDASIYNALVSTLPSVSVSKDAIGSRHVVLAFIVLATKTRLGRTFNGEAEDVSGAVRSITGTESSCRRKRFHEVPHHVDLRLLEALSLSPDDRVVEETECFRDKFALQLSSFTSFHDQHLTASQHLQLHA